MAEVNNGAPAAAPNLPPTELRVRKRVEELNLQFPVVRFAGVCDGLRKMPGEGAPLGDNSDPCKSIVMAHTTGNGHRCARTEPLQPGGAYFLQFKVIEAGPSKFIMFGVGTKKFDFTTIGVYPGSNAESWAMYLTGVKYHADAAAAFGTRSGGWGATDRVGMLVDLREPSPSLSFWKNDDFLGTAYLLPAGVPLYPVVNLYEQSTRVEIMDVTHPFPNM